MTDTLNPFRSRRIKIVEPNWDGYTGTFGLVEFKDGVSVDTVPWLEQQRLAGIIRIESAEEAESGSQLGPAVELVRNRDMSTDDARVQGADVAAIVNGEARVAAANFSREELEQIADKDGITGLRNIATGLGVKGRSINELITEILRAQNGGHDPAE